MPSLAPLNLEDVVNPEWMSWALSRRGEPVEVTAVHQLETLGPSASNVRITLDYAKAPADLPREMCVKGIFRREMDFYITGGTMATETRVYAEVVPNLTVTTPRHYYAEVDPETNAGVILMDDMVARGATFMSALSPYTPEQAMSSLDQLARLHTGTWGDEMKRYPWTHNKTRSMAMEHSLRDEALTEKLQGWCGERLPDEARDGARVHRGMEAIGDRSAKYERCLIHGDAHGGNMFELPGGQLGLLDWQVVQPEHWSVDVAYHLGAALDTEVRRQHEQDLLRHYLDRFAAHGGTPPSWDEAWDRYRESVAYGFWMWAVTQRVVPAIVEQFCQRLGQAVVDHDAWGRLGV